VRVIKVWVVEIAKLCWPFAQLRRARAHAEGLRSLRAADAIEIRRLEARCSKAETEANGLLAEKVFAGLDLLPGAPPGLTPAEIERLAMLMEECGEVVQAAGKVLRHGYLSVSPFGGPNNRVTLERELGDLTAAMDLLKGAGDVRPGDVRDYRKRKRAGLQKWTHHQPGSVLAEIVGEPRRKRGEYGRQEATSAANL
jgi:hypothetical protein